MRIIVFLYYIIIVTINTFCSTENCNSVYYPATNCSDKLDHYECLCGQGQSWNGYSCIADAVDSRLVFNGSHLFPSYIELDSKTFPRISELTISFWLRIWSKINSSQHTILFYRTDDTLPVLLVSLIDGSRLHVELLNQIYDVSTPLAMEQWHHIGISHRFSRSDGIKIMINGSLVVVLISSRPVSSHHMTIDSGGDFLVGQAIRPINLTSEFEFDSQQAFHGELAFLNIWQKVLSDYDLNQLATDCLVQRHECGDAVTWMDFVNDIKGQIQIHWPSGIYSFLGNCPTQQWLQESCDSHCRKIEGPHCKNESQLSIIWPKAIAGETVREDCPGYAKNRSVSRTCQRIEQIARWTPINYSECINPLISEIDEKLDKPITGKEEILILRDKCEYLAQTTMNLTAIQLYSSIDLILLIEQIERLTKALTSHFDSLAQWYSSSYESFYVADINATLHIHQYLVESISNLIDERYLTLWNKTNPLGNDFLRLVTSLQRTTMILAQVLIPNCDQFPGCSIRVQTYNINQTIHVLNQHDLNTFSYENEETRTRVNFVNTKKPSTNKSVLANDEKIDGSTWYSVAVTNLRTAHYYIPNLRLGQFSKYDQLNSHVLSIDVKLRKPIQRSNRLSILLPIDHIPMLLTMGYLKSKNISGHRCVHLETTNVFTSGHYKATLFRQWHWQSFSSVCNITRDPSSEKGTCACLISNGTFAITSDMFNPNWRPFESFLRPLGVFSYIGSFIHITFALLTLVMLTYLRTHSSAAYIHKHYSFVLCCSQIVLILAFNGIPYQHRFLCRAVACTMHFFILSSYCWLMNEAFNLYIQITYTTHPAVAGANVALSDAASKYRFLGMGYILPFGIVTLLASIKKTTYFMPIKTRLCFIDLDDWFKIYFIPISAIIFITVMVMIFSAKQHHESSYTKTEKANEVIVTYTGGIWSQLFLVTISWSVAILPFFYDEIILRLLHGFFNGLQGGFLFLSFFLFNDEIRRHYRDRRRQLRRIQLMEIPYRSSTADTEERHSSVAALSVSPQSVAEPPGDSSSPTEIGSVATAASTLLNQNRKRSSRRYAYNDMKWSLRRRSSNERLRSQEVVSNENASGEDTNDYRITVV